MSASFATGENTHPGAIGGVAGEGEVTEGGGMYLRELERRRARECEENVNLAALVNVADDSLASPDFHGRVRMNRLFDVLSRATFAVAHRTVADPRDDEIARGFRETFEFAARDTGFALAVLEHVKHIEWCLTAQ